jgi:5-methylthioadenosine/S-adenosylhomocysteine deaminase
MSRVLLKSGTVVTMDPAINIPGLCDVLIEDGRIAAIGPNLETGEDVTVIDASDMIVMPGFVNAHIHTWQTGLRSLAGNWTGANYVRAVHAGLATVYTPEDIYIGNLVGALSQIDAGVTTIVDWCHNNPTPDHTDRAIDGLDESGIRALFLHGSPKPEPKPGQKSYREVPMPRSEVKRLREGRFASDQGLVKMGLAVLGPQISVLDVVLEDFRLAKEYDLIASMHHSNSAMYAPDGYAVAASEGLLSDRINVVHGNQLSEADFTLLANHGASFVVTAEVEMQMAYGDPLTTRLRERDVPVAIGSDTETTYAPDMFAVMRVTLQMERHQVNMRQLAIEGERPQTIPVTTGEALRWATIDSAKMAHLDHAIGSLAPGKQADITLLRRRDLNLAGVADPINAIVMHANPRNVDTVFIAGKMMKSKGKLLYENLDRKIAQLEESSERILNDFRAKMTADAAS